MRIGNQKNFWSGLLYIAFGVGFAAVAQNYDMGSAQRMGPAYFPTVLGGLLALIGVVVSLQALRSDRREEDRIEKFHFGPLALILGAVALFGFLLRPAGLIVSLAVMIGIAAYASHEFKFKEAIPLVIVMVLLVLAVFIWGLGLVIPIWPAFVEP